MIGIFDSGVGGLTALCEVRRLLPRADVTYLADRENAPYGTKSEEEILRYVKRNLQRLRAIGAQRILIACCTASTLYSRLTPEEREISVPIIVPAARAAANATKNGKIAIIATRATVRSRAFSRAISAEHGKYKTLEFDAQALVGMVEGGARGSAPLSSADARVLSEILRPVGSFGADTLILGCTHFPHIREHIAMLLPGVNLISPSLEGALELAKSTVPDENGRTVYL
ncbi:MAG: glutamate racemase [Clostridia bacterium]|nr:glutamate racemase [Clostridia bacterium]